MKDRLNKIGEQIIGAAIRVHRELGPGLLESAYEACLEFELLNTGLKVERQILLPVRYREVFVEAGYRLDLWVEQCVIVELKAVDKMTSLFDAQLLSYLKLTNGHLGYLINFNETLLKNGIKRIVRNFPD